MNITKLFETQHVLRDKIGYEEPDRLEKLILALLVEVGECANEWRGFKFWSKDQEPRIRKWAYNSSEGESVYKNPLLEEYVDGLHFVLELGLELNLTPIACDLYLKTNNINSQFVALFHSVSCLNATRDTDSYYRLLKVFVGLGTMLGFTFEAYFDKNKVNHERQENGY